MSCTFYELIRFSLKESHSKILQLVFPKKKNEKKKNEQVNKSVFNSMFNIFAIGGEKEFHDIRVKEYFKSSFRTEKVNKAVQIRVNTDRDPT